MIVKRDNVDVEDEKDILIGMIVSTDFLRKIRRSCSTSYFQLEFVKKIATWVLDYFDKYGEAPSQHIENIYNQHLREFKPEEAELVSLFLEGLSSKYERTDHFNVEYLIQEKAQPYFTKRCVLLTTDKVNALVAAGKTVEAELEIERYKGVQKNLAAWSNLFEENLVREIYKSQLSVEVESSDTLFTLPGVLGQLVGPLKRGWLVDFLAPRKRGKTWFLQEFALQAVQSKLNVVFISLEMNKLGIGGRMLRSIVSMGDKNEYTLPVFDCLNNQYGTCNKPHRKGRGSLVKDGKLVTSWDPELNYRVCNVCRRGVKTSNPEDYQAGIWFENLKRPILTENLLVRNINAFSKYAGEFRLRSYPAFSASITDIKNDLNALEYLEDFVPDVICIDYADIIRPENSKTDFREQANETWKMMKNLAETKQCLVVTATQANRSADESKNVKSTQVGWDIRKNDHVDAQFPLSQLWDEKRRGVIRLSNSLHRWKEVGEDQVYVLQSLPLAQVLLDSEWVPSASFETNV